MFAQRSVRLLSILLLSGSSLAPAQEPKSVSPFDSEAKDSRVFFTPEDAPAAKQVEPDVRKTTKEIERKSADGNEQLLETLKAVTKLSQPLSEEAIKKQTEGISQLIDDLAKQQLPPTQSFPQPQQPPVPASPRVFFRPLQSFEAIRQQQSDEDLRRTQELQNSAGVLDRKRAELEQSRQEFFNQIGEQPSTLPRISIDSVVPQAPPRDRFNELPDTKFGNPKGPVGEVPSNFNDQPQVFLGTPVSDPLPDRSRAAFTLDFSRGVNPEVPKELDQDKMRKAAAGYVLNMFNNLGSPVRIPSEAATLNSTAPAGSQIERFTIGRLIDTGADEGTNQTVSASSAFDFQKFDRLLRDEGRRNPYACSGSSTNPSTAAPRGDWMISELMRAPVYYAMAGIPETVSEYRELRGYGVREPGNPDLANTHRAIIQDSNVAAPRVGAMSGDLPDRLAEFFTSKRRELRGRTAFMTLDKDSNPDAHASPEDQEREDIRNHPFDFQRSVGELVAERPNGMLEFALYNRQGRRQDFAPDSAVDATNSDPYTPVPVTLAGNTIRAPLSCVGCHRNGHIKGSIGSYDPKTFFSSDLSEKERKDAARTINPDEYSARLASANREYRETLKAAGIDTTYPVLNAYTNSYHSDLGLDQAAREFGISSSKLTEALRKPENQKLRTLLGLPKRAEALNDELLRKHNIPRARFAARFCDVDFELSGRILTGINREEFGNRTGGNAENRVPTTHSTR